MANGNPPNALFQIRVLTFDACMSPADPENFWRKPIECRYVIFWPGHEQPVRIKPSKHNHHYPIYSNGDISLHVGHYQKRYTYQQEPRIATTIRLGDADDKRRVPRATLQFDIVDESGNPGPYYPVGAAFCRADKTDPIGTPFTTGAQLTLKTIKELKEDSPFFGLRLNHAFRRIEFNVEAISNLRTIMAAHKTTGKQGSHRTYRFIIFIQHQESGEIGIIDPEIEPPI